jgi:hypothetical protein
MGLVYSFLQGVSGFILIQQQAATIDRSPGGHRSDPGWVGAERNMPAETVYTRQASKIRHRNQFSEPSVNTVSREACKSMETPPPYRPAKKSNSSTIIILIIVGLVVCCAGPLLLIGGGGFYMWGQVTPLLTCEVGLKDVHEAMKDYAADHKGLLPPAATWEDDIRPYYTKELGKHKKSGPFKLMPAAGPWGCGAGSTGTGFCYNSALAGKKLSGIADRSLPLVFEVPTVGSNQANTYTKLDPKTSPKIVNEPRGWMIVTVDGDTYSNSPKGTRTRFSGNNNF